MSGSDEVFVSAQTLERMKRELNELTTAGRDEMSERLRKAREFGDIRENADYDAAKDAQGLMEARIRQLQQMVSKAVVRESMDEVDEAGPGVIVTVRDPGTGELEEYLLAASTEEKMPGIQTASTGSPLGTALMGKRIGETVVVRAPAGEFPLEVVALRGS